MRIYLEIWCNSKKQFTYVCFICFNVPIFDMQLTRDNVARQKYTTSWNHNAAGTENIGSGFSIQKGHHHWDTIQSEGRNQSWTFYNASWSKCHNSWYTQLIPLMCELAYGERVWIIASDIHFVMLSSRSALLVDLSYRPQMNKPFSMIGKSSIKNTNTLSTSFIWSVLKIMSSLSYE